MLERCHRYESYCIKSVYFSFLFKCVWVHVDEWNFGLLFICHLHSNAQLKLNSRLRPMFCNDFLVATILYTTCGAITPTVKHARSSPVYSYLVNALINLAEICRKKMDAMKEMARTMTT